MDAHSTTRPQNKFAGPETGKEEMMKFLETSALTLVVAVYGLALLPLLAPGLAIA